MGRRSNRSAGILLFRRSANRGLEVLLVHPGGPFWARKDNGAWSVPKGEPLPDEDLLDAARREFAEETGGTAPLDTIPLGEERQPSRKVVTVFAGSGDFDPETLVSNTFPCEWPPRSGRVQEFPEVDRAGWFTPDEARVKLLAGQVVFVDRLLVVLGEGDDPA